MSFHLCDESPFDFPSLTKPPLVHDVRYTPHALPRSTEPLSPIKSPTVFDSNNIRFVSPPNPTSTDATDMWTNPKLSPVQGSITLPPNRPDPQRSFCRSQSGAGNGSCRGQENVKNPIPLGKTAITHKKSSLPVGVRVEHVRVYTISSSLLTISERFHDWSCCFLDRRTHQTVTGKAGPHILVSYYSGRNWIEFKIKVLRLN